MHSCATSTIKGNLNLNIKQLLRNIIGVIEELCSVRAYGSENKSTDSARSQEISDWIHGYYHSLRARLQQVRRQLKWLYIKCGSQDFMAPDL